MAPQNDRGPQPASQGPNDHTRNTNTASSVRRTASVPTDRHIGCPSGCPLDHHECGHDDPARPACPGRCQTFGIAELRRIGELHGGCPCAIERGVA